MSVDEKIEAALELVGRIDAVPKILGAVHHSTGMGVVAIVHTTDEHWILCDVLDHNATGLRPGDVFDLKTMICADVEDMRAPVVIDCVDEDLRYADHPARNKADFRSFLSFPITLKDGTIFGTLCAFDPEPRGLQGKPQLESVGFLADLLASHIDAAKRLSNTWRILRDEQAASELREQFIAVLGHDLRNPVAAVTSGTRMLLRMETLDEHAIAIARLIQGSALRMNGLIDNLLDFARGRLGDGITLSRNSDTPLHPVLSQVIDEARATTHHRIETDLDFDDPVNCDTGRIGQLASNLIGNAVRHGAVEAPVRVDARRKGAYFSLSVANSGDPIPDEARAVLFRPFARGADNSGGGLGLGLYIAAEIARGHGGEITYTSTSDETRFTLTMPV